MAIKAKNIFGENKISKCSTAIKYLQEMILIAGERFFCSIKKPGVTG